MGYFSGSNTSNLNTPPSNGDPSGHAIGEITKYFCNRQIFE